MGGKNYQQLDEPAEAVKYVLMLDYDGTLTPIKKRSELAVLTAKRREFLRRLSRRPNIKLAIVSGRKLSEIKRLVNIPNLIYAGNHGFEIEFGRRRFIHPSARRFMPQLKRIKSALAAALRIKGVIIEDKVYTISVHYRLVKRKDSKKFRRLFDAAMNKWKDKAKITSGKKVLEIRSPIDWNKGKAVKWLIKNLKLSEYKPVYIGDDRTDDDAFRALRGRGETIFVGRGRTSAKKRLKNVAEVYRHLREFTQ